MTFTPLYRKSNHINVHLTTNNPDIQNLIDEILNEISVIKKITNRPKSREALKKILLNLIHADKIGGCIRISRDKNSYGHHRMYGKLWFKYDRLIPVIDGLMELGYVEHLNGSWDKKAMRGFQTKIWSSQKLKNRLIGILMPGSGKTIDRAEPKQVIQLKDQKKKLTKYTPLKPITKMRGRLEQYNDFIREQYITVKLPEAVMTDNEFWVNNLLRGLLDGSYGLDRLALNQDITCMDKTYINHGREASSDHATISSSSYAATISTHTAILSPSTTTSTLLSHILNLIHLYSTQEKQPNRLTDGAIMISNDQLCEYFLNWLMFLNKGLKIGKTKKQTRWQYRNRMTLGKLGMSELVFRLKYESLHRVFNKSTFSKGGRFYGASHLDIPSHMRGFIRINGEPVVELDYDALHVVMLYHLRGIDIDLEQDPYSMIVGPEDRTAKKIALLTAINAPDDDLAIKGIRKKLVGEGYRGEILTDKSLDRLIARAKLAHPDIKNDIASGKGITLQNIDSKIADAILTNFLTEGIPALPVHDSFIVPERYEGILRKQMMDEYEKILKFKPGVSKKTKRFIPKKWL